MTTESLEARVARLEAIEEIKQLKARYCAYCDDSYDADAIASLFTEDAVWDGGGSRGRHEGREAILTFFQGVTERIGFAAHLVMNPIIEVNGDSATGSWWLIMPYTARQGGTEQSRWQVGAYSDTYVRQNGRWMISGLKVTIISLDPETNLWARL